MRDAVGRLGPDLLEAGCNSLFVLPLDMYINGFDKERAENIHHSYVHWSPQSSLLLARQFASMHSPAYAITHELFGSHMRDWDIPVLLDIGLHEFTYDEIAASLGRIIEHRRARPGRTAGQRERPRGGDVRIRYLTPEYVGLNGLELRDAADKYLPEFLDSSL